MNKIVKYVVVVVGFFVLSGVDLCSAKEAKKEAKGKKGDEAKILFQDDFSDLEYTKENWKWKEGVTIINDNGEFEIGSEIKRGDDWTDYILEARIKILEMNEAGHSGFRLRINNEEQKAVMFFILKNAIGVLINNKSTQYLKKTFEPETWYSFKFICEGSTIEVLVDDEELGVIKDETMPLKGKISTWAYKQRPVYDDVKITEIKKK